MNITNEWSTLKPLSTQYSEKKNGNLDKDYEIKKRVKQSDVKKSERKKWQREWEMKGKNKI